MRLFYEDVNEALREVVNHLGGAKKVGVMLWPDKSVEQAHPLLLACFNTERRERLTPEQVVLLLKWGREQGCHAALHFICDTTGYHRPDPINSEDEKARLQREFVEGVKHLNELEQRMEAMGGVQLRAVKG